MAIFKIEKFVFKGAYISRTLPQEAACVETLIDTPIDPDILAQSSSVSDALSAIAINYSNFACAHLSSVYSDAANLLPKEQSTSTLVSVVRPGELPNASFTAGPVSVGDAPSPPGAVLLLSLCWNRESRTWPFRSSLLTQ